LNPDRDIHLAAAVLQKMEKHTWPGNLRQLASVLRTSSAMLGPHEDSIEWGHLPDDIAEDLALPVPSVLADTPMKVSQNLDALAKAAIQQALESSHGNVSQAARLLGISRQTMYRKMALDPTPTNQR
jgi:transcriptional regulator of acetoin/glycerol metabolism